mmetsp:Transcript_36869/g.96583  ORF Transcript_36869/g.96583 Transcript_36869/m.96583 type:complete len:202 (+) Transcript_36869:1538-2143(+)
MRRRAVRLRRCCRSWSGISCHFSIASLEQGEASARPLHIAALAMLQHHRQSLRRASSRAGIRAGHRKSPQQAVALALHASLGADQKMMQRHLPVLAAPRGHRNGAAARWTAGGRRLARRLNMKAPRQFDQPQPSQSRRNQRSSLSRRRHRPRQRHLRSREPRHQSMSMTVISTAFWSTWHTQPTTSFEMRKRRMTTSSEIS